MSATCPLCGDPLTAAANVALQAAASIDTRPGSKDAARGVIQLGDALAVAVRIADRFGVSPKAAAVMLRAIFSRLRREKASIRAARRAKAGAH